MDHVVLLNANHRMLRANDGITALRAHLLGVKLVASLVNRHRIKVYLLDAAGAIAGSFQRVHWTEQKTRIERLRC
jgi:protein SCO1/2